MPYVTPHNSMNHSLALVIGGHMNANGIAKTPQASKEGTQTKKTQYATWWSFREMESQLREALGGGIATLIECPAESPHH